METPIAILKAAGNLVPDVGSGFNLVGSVDGWDVYVLQIDGEKEIGYPFVYLYKDGKVKEVFGEDIFDLFASLGVE